MPTEQNSLNYSLILSGTELHASAISAVHIDETELTVDQKGYRLSRIRPLVLRALGNTSAEVARMTYRSEDTIKTHLRKFYKELGAKSISHAVSRSFEEGILTVKHPLPQAKLRLTGRELQILQATARGLDHDDIGEELNLSPWTVKTHFTHITKRAGTTGYGAQTLVLLGYMTDQLKVPAHTAPSEETPVAAIEIPYPQISPEDFESPLVPPLSGSTF